MQVTLLWALNYTGEQQVAMSLTPGGAPGTYSASIPAGVTDAGCMIRWAVQVRAVGAVIEYRPKILVMQLCTFSQSQCGADVMVLARSPFIESFTCC